MGKREADAVERLLAAEAGWYRRMFPRPRGEYFFLDETQVKDFLNYYHQVPGAAFDEMRGNLNVAVIDTDQRREYFQNITRDFAEQVLKELKAWRRR